VINWAMAWTLYYSPGACSLAAHIVLHELARPFETVRTPVAEGAHLRPEYLRLNPHGRVPTLVVDDQPIRELSGILTWLGQQGGLFPPAGAVAAAKCSEWLGWLTSAVHISFALLWRGERFLETRELHPQLQERGFRWIDEQFGEIEQALTGRDWLLDAYSVADANLLPFYRWGQRVGYDMRAAYPAWTAHTEGLLDRPAVQRAVQAEGIEIWAAPDPAFSARRPAPRPV
jgi:glutathione S-transferase